MVPGYKTATESITAIHPETGLKFIIKKYQLWRRIKRIHKKKAKYILWRIAHYKYDPHLVGIYWFEHWEEGKHA